MQVLETYLNSTAGSYRKPQIIDMWKVDRHKEVEYTYMIHIILNWWIFLWKGLPSKILIIFIKLCRKITIFLWRKLLSNLQWINWEKKPPNNIVPLLRWYEQNHFWHSFVGLYLAYVLYCDNYITKRSVRFRWYYGFSIAAASARRPWRREHSN